MVKDPSPLVGQGVGDALGMPFETCKATDPRLTSWDGSYLPSEYHKLAPGQWTDDTMMAKIVMESLFLCGGFYPQDLADRYRHWLISGDLRGMGKSTKHALENLVSGSPWCDSGIEGAEGSGTAMRAAPFGIFYHDDLYTAAEFARMDARITHRSIEAEEGSAAIAVAMGLVLTGVDPELLISKVLGYLRDSNVKRKLVATQVLVEKEKSGRSSYAPNYVAPPGSTLKEVLFENHLTTVDLSQATGLDKELIEDLIGGNTHLSDTIASRLESVLQIPSSFWLNLQSQYDTFRGLTGASRTLLRIGTSAHVVETVPSAIAAFLLTTTFETSVSLAIRVGGDTDTRAAMTGALAGTLYGFEAIPKKYREGLENVDHFRRLEPKLFKGPRTSALWML